MNYSMKRFTNGNSIELICLFYFIF